MSKQGKIVSNAVYCARCDNARFIPANRPARQRKITDYLYKHDWACPKDGWICPQCKNLVPTGSQPQHCGTCATWTLSARNVSSVGGRCTNNKAYPGEYRHEIDGAQCPYFSAAQATK